MCSTADHHLRKRLDASSRLPTAPPSAPLVGGTACVRKGSAGFTQACCRRCAPPAATWRSSACFSMARARPAPASPSSSPSRCTGAMACQWRTCAHLRRGAVSMRSCIATWRVLYLWSGAAPAALCLIRTRGTVCAMRPSLQAYTCLFAHDKAPLASVLAGEQPSCIFSPARPLSTSTWAWRCRAGGAASSWTAAAWCAPRGRTCRFTSARLRTTCRRRRTCWRRCARCGRRR